MDLLGLSILSRENLTPYPHDANMMMDEIEGLDCEGVTIMKKKKKGKGKGKMPKRDL